VLLQIAHTLLLLLSTFVCAGGEGALFADSVSNSAHCNIAVEWLQETGALMFGIEHRYYGCHNLSSCPYNLKTADKWKYLSSQQALADIASFHQFASKEFGLSTDNKWISWGGSYPGMLAGWSRLKYPELIHAAVASSAPVKAQLDQQVFEDIVASAYAVEMVGGSNACESAIRTGHQKVGALLAFADGRTQLAKLFPKRVKSAAWLEDRSHQRTFAGCGVAFFPAQSNDPACGSPACNIKHICALMTVAGDPVTNLAAVASAQGLGEMNLDCEMDWTAPTAPAGLPPWGYQVCNEFGFYQTCEEGSSCFYVQV
jgi:hypothetical protein